MKARMISKSDEERLFTGAIDGALAEADRAQLASTLEGSPELKAKFDSYARAVKLLKGTQPEKAPAALAGQILRRTRRRRWSDRRAFALAHAQYRVPVEVIIPILVGVLMAAFLIFSAR